MSASGARTEALTFNIETPWQQLAQESFPISSQVYTRITIPGWPNLAEPGAPALPFVSEMIGAPQGAQAALRVTPGRTRSIQLAAPPLPTATQTAEWGVLPSGWPEVHSSIKADPRIYSGQAAFPSALAEIVTDGYLRQQRVMGVAVYPIQYNPAQQTLTIYETLQVEVTFSQAAGAASHVLAVGSPDYEGLLEQNLLNYAAARQWRAEPGAAAPALHQAGDASAEGWAPPAPGWRVKVHADGFYRLSYAELKTAGLPVDSLDARSLQLFHLGSEVAIQVVGEGDGKFGSDDALIFYGQGIQNKYTLDNVYWLTYGKQAGLRMAARDGAPGAGQTPAVFPASLHLEENHYYLSLIPGDEHVERWVWDYLYPPSKASWSHNFTLTAPASGPARLTVNLLGYLQNTIFPDHHALISLNGTQVGDVKWDGVAWKTVEMDVPAGVLTAGNNTLTVTSPNDTGVGYDVFYVDWAELAFPSAFQASGDVLAFDYDTAGDWNFALSGFTSPDLAVYDAGNPSAVQQITNVSVTNTGAGYTLEFGEALTAPTTYWALGGAGYRSVQAIEADSVSNLRSTANGADYLVITPLDFSAQAGALRDYRAEQGLRAVRVDVQDVYDEFGYGITSAQAIHDFLAHAYGSWQAPAPSYVVLLGDGHYDPKNFSGYGRTSYIPPFLAPADPWIGETAADNRYVTLVGDDTLPDMMLGRLAVNSPTEAAAFVDKIIAYEQTPAPGDWRGKVLAVADNADSAGDFAQISDDLLADHLPAGYQAERVYLGKTHTNSTAARSAIQAGFNAGTLVVNYIGHAYNVAWASEGLFQASDVAGLSNGGKLPVILAMTCREGSYHSPLPLSDGQEALAEVVTRAAGKGAVASWSPTGLGVASGHDYLNRGFFDTLFSGEPATAGEAAAAGKLNLWMAGGSLDLLDTYLLFGDPAMTMTPAPAKLLYLPVIVD